MFAAHAVVHSSCTKLRSIIAIGHEATGCDPLLLPEILDSLVAVQPLLEDAEKRSVRMEYECRTHDMPRAWWPAEELAMQDWLRRVTNSAYKISDMLDVLQDTRNTAPPPARKIKMFTRRDNVPENKNPVALKLEFEEMKDELSKLVAESAQFNLSPFDPGSIVEPITDSPVGGEVMLLARDEEIKRIVAASDSCEEGPIIVNIVGGDGSGKTSIARLVFNHTRFKQYARVWICVGSQKFNLQRIGKSIISQASGEEEASYHSWDGNMEPITELLGELLDKGMKLLVVLDDADLSGEDIIQLKRMLSVGHNKEDTKLMVVVTSKSVTRPETFTVPPLYLEPFSGDECWSIIKQRSGFEDRSDKQELESIGREIANRCQGIPLQAAVLGAILRYKDAKEWSQTMKLDIIHWQTNGYTAPFLELAYTSMPPSLRLCFAYFSILPAGHPVAKHDLIHQWIALRLLEPSDRFSAKQLGEYRIRMLQGMSLLQTTKPSDPTSGRDDNGVIMLTMHPKVHELAASLVCGSDISNPYFVPKELFSYRYALATNCGFWPKELSSTLADRLRALRCVGCSKMEITDEAFSSAIWLRVLELREHSMQKLPGSISQLRHLGYLNLSGCSRLETLPESFGDLLQLLHINLSGCSGLVTLPESFGKLINIVHIDLSGCSKLEKLPQSIVKLINLVRIDLAGCSALVRLPELLWKLTDLEHIDLSGCYELVHLPGSFAKLINLVYINLSGCSKLVKLPQSFEKVVHLPHLNLSGCSGLAKLPGSFCKLEKVTHISLSGCSRLKNLPASFGKLKKLVHIDLSGCCGLVTLPESFGDITDLQHINLSRCYALSKLPQSFRKLEKLQHLDLSFWSCFGVIRTALVGRSNLQHLNLSHPCCSLAQNRPDLQGLKEVLSRLTSLQYLNLSRFLNPMLDSLSEETTEVVLKEKEEDIGGYIECISGLSSLEHLDLSHNMFIRDAPECLGGLSKLHTLDLSGCIRLKIIAKRIGEMKSLKSLILRNCRSLKSYQLVVQAVDDDGVAYSSHSSNLILLKDADIEELEISCLENVKSIEDWQKVRLAAKRRLEKLKLCWTTSVRRSRRSVQPATTAPYLLDHALPGELWLPQSLQCLEIRGYNGKIYPAVWWKNDLISLAEVTLEDVSMCSQLPPLGILPNLQQLVLRRMTSLTRIDGGDMSFGNRPASNPLSRFTIENMVNLEQFNTTYHGSADGEFLMFPAMTLLVIVDCPKLCFLPAPPRAQSLAIVDCSRVMTGWRLTGEGPSVGCPPPVTKLFVQKCNAQLDQWKLLHHLPGLVSLIIIGCEQLNSSPEIMGALSSLQILEIRACYGVTSLPEHLGDLASLRKLKIGNCMSVEYLPDSMQKLAYLESLHLCDCRSLVQLPEWLGDLTSLRELTLDGSWTLKCLPESIRKLTNLEFVHIPGCRKLKDWCESEENKFKLAHIRPKYEKLDFLHEPWPPLQTPAASLPQQYQALSQPPGPNTHWQAAPWQGPPQDFSASSAQQHQWSPQPPPPTAPWQGAPYSSSGFQWHQHQELSQPSWQTAPWNGTTRGFVATPPQQQPLPAMSAPRQHQSMPQSSCQTTVPWQGGSQDFAVAATQQHQMMSQSSSQGGALRSFVEPLQQQHQALYPPSWQTAPWHAAPRPFATSFPQQHQVSQSSRQAEPWQGGSQDFTVAAPQKHQMMSQSSWPTVPSQAAPQTFVEPLQQQHQAPYPPSCQNTTWQGAPQAFVDPLPQQHQALSHSRTPWQTAPWQGAPRPLAPSLPPQHHELSQASWQGGPQAFPGSLPQQYQVMSQPSWHTAPCASAPVDVIIPRPLPQEYKKMPQPSCHTTLERRASW